MTTQQTNDVIVYENMSTQPEAAYNTNFTTNVDINVVPQVTYVPQSQPMYMSQPPPSSMYASQPMYIPQQQPQSQPQQTQQQQQQPYPQVMQSVYMPPPQSTYGVSSQQPVYISMQPQPLQLQAQPLSRENAIKAQLQFKNCCCCFSYPGGIKFLSIFEIFVWIIWAVSGITMGMWWLWIFVVAALIMGYFGYMGADKMIEQYLRLFMNYLGVKALIYFVMIYVFAYFGYDFNLALWSLMCVLMAYWYYVARELVTTIHDFDAVHKISLHP